MEFPSKEWLEELGDTLNSDEQYAQVARNWEGDLLFVIEPDEGEDTGGMIFYMDLWHGKCRGWESYNEGDPNIPRARFSLSATRSQFMKVLEGKLDPMQAMLTRKLRVQGDMGYMLRNVPVVLDFVRCARGVGEARP